MRQTKISQRQLVRDKFAQNVCQVQRLTRGNGRAVPASSSSGPGQNQITKQRLPTPCRRRPSSNWKYTSTTSKVIPQLAPWFAFEIGAPSIGKDLFKRKEIAKVFCDYLASVTQSQSIRGIAISKAGRASKPIF